MKKTLSLLQSQVALLQPVLLVLRTVESERFSFFLPNFRANLIPNGTGSDRFRADTPQSCYFCSVTIKPKKRPSQLDPGGGSLSDSLERRWFDVVIIVDIVTDVAVASSNKEQEKNFNKKFLFFKQTSFLIELQKILFCFERKHFFASTRFEKVGAS